MDNSNNNIIIVILIAIIAILLVGFTVGFVFIFNQDSENNTETNQTNTTELITGTNNNNNPSNNYIGESNAISIVKSVEFAHERTNFVAVLTTSKGKPMYKVTFISHTEYYGNLQQIIYVDAVTGTILWDISDYYRGHDTSL